jgi:lipopolysaccharide export system permease protein
MKTFDRYLIRELAFPVFYSCFSLVFLVLIADLFNNLDDILHHRTPVLTILKYYLSLVPFAFTQTVAWAAWLGTLFLLVTFGFHNETLAMKAAGLKITAIIKPILFFGFLLGIMTFLINDKVVPKTARIAKEIREAHILDLSKRKVKTKNMENVTYTSNDDVIYYFRTFSPNRDSVEGAVILWLGDKGQSSRKKMLAKKGTWKEGQWTFEGVTEYQMDSRGRILGEPETFPSKGYPEISFTPKELTIASTDQAFLNYRELKQSIQKLKENGVDVSSEQVDLHYRLSAPWQGLVMMIIAVPFLAKTTNRKAVALNVLFCVGVIFAYHVTGAVGIALGKAGKIFPFLSAWTGNILFASAALATIDKANY